MYTNRKRDDKDRLIEKPEGYFHSTNTSETPGDIFGGENTIGRDKRAKGPTMDEKDLFVVILPINHSICL